jgi:hypothetical protein
MADVPITLDELADALGEAIGVTSKEVETELRSDFQSQHAALAARVARLEAIPRLRYHGVWQAAQEYTEGSMVSCSGSLWIAKSATGDQRPGNGATAWQLAVKRGRG